MQSFQKIVVVAGCQRSGTTLTGQILGAHPNALMIDEPDGLYRWFEAYEADDPKAETLWDEMLNAANAKYRRGQKRVRRARGAGVKALAPNVTHLILKAPNLTYSYDAITRLNCPVSVVYPVRDPRSVVASMTKLRHIPMVERQLTLIRRQPSLASELNGELTQLGDDTVPLHIKRALVWRIKSCLYDQFSARGLPVFRFRYEDLITDPAGFSKGMAAHVGLAFDANMLAHEMVYSGFGPGMTERSRPIDGQSLARWSDRLTEEQEQDILHVTADAMKLLGYDPAATSAPPAAPIPDTVLRQPIIFTGRGGSGTRLLSEIAVDCGVFLGNRRNVSGDSLEWVELIYEMVIQQNSRKPDRKDRPRVGWERLLLGNARDVLGQGKWQDNQPWGWKLPETMVVMPELFETFRAARLVHLVRHPVDSSLRRTHMTSRGNNPMGRSVLAAAYAYAGRDPVGIRHDPEYMHNAVTWLYQVKLVAEFGRSLPPGRYLQIRYEDICTDPLRAQAQIADFIGVICDVPAMLAIKADRMRDYELPDARVDKVWALCGQTATELGYDPVT